MPNPTYFIAIKMTNLSGRAGISGQMARAKSESWNSLNSSFFSAYFFSWDGLYVNALSSSRGRGKMIVEFFSAAISVSVPRNLS